MRPVLCVLALGIVSSWARGATLVDNLSLATQYLQLGAGWRGAQPFQTTSDQYLLTDISIIGYRTSSFSPIALKIYDTGSPYGPGNEVATVFSGTTGTAGFSDNFSLALPSVFAGLSIALQPGATYWLVLENRSSDHIWFGYTAIQGSAPGQGPGYITGSKVAGALTGSFDVNNTREYSARILAVPEPSVLPLFILGVVFVCFRREIRTA